MELKLKYYINAYLQFHRDLFNNQAEKSAN